MGRFSVELKLANSIDVALVRRGLLAPEDVRQMTIRGVVDTGATRLVIPASVAEQLGAREVAETRVRYADNRTVTRELVDDVQVELLGRQATFRAAVEPDRVSALIGAIVLEDLDFVVDCTTQTLRPRDPNQIISEIETHA
ncbi:MAG: aspartyl protease family protein [Deltaproteobacteria bacterium]|nr:aspartyl protease family protein [Deltaproteobacteria bacterium]